MTTYTKHGARRGVTLIEAVLFISIALGLIVGGLVFFQQASLAARTNDAVRSISGLASEIRAAYRTQDTFTGITPAVLISSGAVPSSQVNAAGTGIVNEWSHPVLIRGNAAGTPAPLATAGQFFEIEYENIPVAACTRLATATDGNGPIGPGIVSIRVRAANAAANAGGTLIAGRSDLNGRVDITPAEAAATTGCNVAAPVDVIFTLAR